FSVTNSSGTTVYSAPVGGNLGKWSASYPDVYALDFPAAPRLAPTPSRSAGPSPPSPPLSRSGPRGKLTPRRLPTHRPSSTPRVTARTSSPTLSAARRGT